MAKFFVFSILILVNVASAAQNQVRVQSRAEVTADRILLGDVAAILCDDPKAEKVLTQIDLGESPALGRKILMTASELSQKLRSHVQELEGVQIKLPDTLTIYHVNHSITVASLTKKIKEAVRVLLPDPSWTLDVSAVQLPEGLSSIQSSDYQIVVPLQRPKGATVFELIVQQEKSTKRFWIPARIKYSGGVAVLLHQVNTQSHFNESDYLWQMRDLTYINDIPATKTEMDSGVARYSLAAGTPVMRSQLEREMALKFGQQVQIIAGDDSFNISSKGVAQQNGFIGDVVKVRSETSSKIVDGVVVAKGVVNVRY